MIQIVLTPAAGKRLIAKAIAAHPAIQASLQAGTLDSSGWTGKANLR